MRFTTDLLYKFIAASRRGSARPDEVTLELPPLLLPVLNAIGPFGSGASDSATINRESFSFDAQSIFGPSTAGAPLDVARFGFGLWDLIITINLDSDFTDGVGSSRGSVMIGPPGIVNVVIWIAGRLIANTRNAPVTLYVPILVPDDGWTLILNHSATGVAQNSNFRVSGLGLRRS